MGVDVMQNDSTLHTSDPFEYLKNEFGKVVPFEIVKMKPEAFANIFSEGSPALKKLLNKLWENDIRTIGCCVGHKNRDYFYKTDDRNRITLVDKKEYNWHRFSKKYHRVKEDDTAYLALDPRTLKSPHELGNEITNELYSKKLPFEFTVGTLNHMVTVYLDEYVEKDKRELFFETLSDTLEKYLLKEQNRTKPAIQENKKTAFQDMVSHAEQRANDLNDRQKTYMKEHQQSFSK